MFKWLKEIFRKMFNWFGNLFCKKNERNDEMEEKNVETTNVEEPLLKEEKQQELVVAGNNNTGILSGICYGACSKARNFGNWLLSLWGRRVRPEVAEVPDMGVEILEVAEIERVDALPESADVQNAGKSSNIEEKIVQGEEEQGEERELPKPEKKLPKSEKEQFEELLSGLPEHEKIRYRAAFERTEFEREMMECKHQRYEERCQLEDQRDEEKRQLERELLEGRLQLKRELLEGRLQREEEYTQQLVSVIEGGFKGIIVSVDALFAEFRISLRGLLVTTFQVARENMMLKNVILQNYMASNRSNFQMNANQEQQFKLPKPMLAITYDHKPEMELSEESLDSKR